ncbi:MAG: anthranilate phosphoribosyltransferase [Bryobacteraceae bacterium]|jgi:anthranilate phosphoribosyltransferase
MPLLPHLERLAAGSDLSADEAQSAMQTILDGKASPAQIAGLLMALRVRGETVDELVGFARAMRQTAVRVELDLPGEALIDTCGTGGDGAGTFNISTVAAFVVAGAGVRVAKHGNRAVTGKSGCGSADLLDSFGIAIDTTPAAPQRAARAIREIGIGFFFAPAVHTAMRHAAPVRADLKIRTAFNLLGPLTNPAGANAQVVGAPSEREAQLLAGALAALGLPRGFVVHGSDGLDEITTTGPTLVFEIRDGHVERRTLEPADFAVPIATAEQLKGGDKQRNFEIATAALNGERGAPRDIVIANAAAALVAAGLVETFLEGAAIAAVSINSGAARGKVEALAAFSAVGKSHEN